MERILREFPLNIREKSILGYMGYPRKSTFYSGARVNNAKRAVHELIQENWNLVRPSGIYKIFSCKCQCDFISLVDVNWKLTSSYLAKRFQLAEKIGFFVVTIGEALEEKVTTLLQCGMLGEALILDSIGSEAAESAAHFLHSHIQKEFGCRLVRYSPGFKDPMTGIDWKITDQKIIFELLRPEIIGVTLSPDCMMKPRKSISAIIGPKSK